MAKFYVGQRVRIKKSYIPERIGLEATVIAYSFSEHVYYGYGYFVDIEIDGLGRIGPLGNRFASPEENLEPMIPPHQACDDAEFIASLDRLAAKVEEMA